jgi:hypothetical protein
VPRIHAPARASRVRTTPLSRLPGPPPRPPTSNHS